MGWSTGSLSLGGGGGAKVTEDFERGALGETATALSYNPSLGFGPDPDANTIFDAQDFSGNPGEIIFVNGRSGLGVTRTESGGGVGLLKKWVNGFDYVNNLVTPMKGDLVTSVWSRVEHTQATATFPIFSIDAYSPALYEKNGDGFDSGHLMFSYNLPQFSNPGLFFRARRGDWSGTDYADSTNTYNYGLTLVQGAWQQYEFTVTAKNQYRARALSEDGTVLFDSGMRQGASGWYPAQITVATMNQQGTVYTADDFMVSIGGDGWSVGE